MKTALEVIKGLVKKYPNDMKLGSSVRHFIYQLENTEQDYKQWKQKWDTCNG
jgi:hypothetical protein|tara:strand:+ start:92 stop:247 length:156 start_codon:yes stop_codon:yes gene_type:complete